VKFTITILALIGIVVGFGISATVEAAGSSANVNLRVAIVSEATLSANATKRSGAGVTANVRTGSSPATLTITATNDTDTGTGNIPASSATVKSTDKNCYFSPEASGPLNRKSSSGKIAQPGCVGSYTETFDLYLEKDWKCSTGNPTITVTYTLTAP